MSASSNELKLRVIEALSKDVGRAIVRMDPEDLQKLQLQIGDIVEVVGKRSTVGKAMPAYKEQRGHDRIQMDGITRENAGISLDESVLVRKARAAGADRLTLIPTTVTPTDRDLNYIGNLLDGLPVVAGDRVRVTLFGSRAVNFNVEATTPRGPVVIHPSTQLLISTSRAKHEDSPVLSYEDIGGLRPQLQRIREMVELPLRYPEVFERLGVDAPKGVLLYGPPGCGKTLIARAIAHETEASFFSINGPEIIHKFYGESEAHLRKIFEEATRKSPSIIFLDEIDAIAPRRERVVGDVEKRVVAQLLALMDGLERRAQVIVIAATNIPDALDPALRRPGRFDRELAIHIPDRRGRQEILEIHSRGMPLADNVDISHLASITHGYVGADLEALCREAAMLRLRQVMTEIDFDQAHIPYDLLAQLEVRMEDFVAAFQEIEPSAIREVFVDVADVRWKDVGGLQSVKAHLREAVEWPLAYPELFERAGVRPAKGILLSGPPGCGKTLLAKALATESQVNFISVKGPALLSMYVGESERGVREVFRKARQAAPCILFLDEIDALVPARGGGADSPVVERVLSQFLTEMDGVEELKGVLILGATNRPDLLDPAIMRPGRFDLQIEIPLPDNDERREIFAIHLRGKPVGAGVTISELATNTEGFSAAEIAGICRRAAMEAIRRRILSSGAETPDPGALVVEPEVGENADRYSGNFFGEFNE